MATAPSPFASLPVELVRRILELAAVECKRSALALALLSQDIHQWITPIIYRTVILGVWTEALFLRTLQATTSTTGVYVRNLFLDEDYEHGKVNIPILTGCPCLERLVLDVEASRSLKRNLNDATTSSWPAPWEVSMQHSNGWLLLGHPILRNVTHLTIHNPSPRPHEAILMPCLSLPRLTHLGLGFLGGDEFVVSMRWLLSTDTSLQMVLIHSNPRIPAVMPFAGGTWVQLATIEDERLFARPGVRSREFGDLLLSGRTIWDDVRVDFKDWRAAVRKAEEGWIGCIPE